MKKYFILFALIFIQGCSSGGGDDETTLVTPPSIISFTSLLATITVGEDTTLTGVFANGTGSIDANVGIVTSGVDVTVTPTITTTYTLTVTNVAGASVSAQVTVTVIPAPSITSFIAADSIITVGEDTTLTGVFANGTGIIGNGVGTVISGENVIVSPAITTGYILTVTNSEGVSVSAQVTVTVEPNSAPVADAGPDQTVSTGALVMLDGSNSSDANNDLLTYDWSFQSIPSGSSTTLSDSSAESPTFTIDANGSYVLDLVVNDGFVDSAIDSVIITAQSLPALTYKWAITLGSAVDDSGKSIAIDANDNIFVFGYFNNTVDFDPSGSDDSLTEVAGPNGDYFITKYNSDGSYGWTNIFASNDRNAGEKSIDIDSSGNIYLTGIDTNRDMVIRKIDTDGVLLWEKSMTTDGFMVKGISIDIDSGDNVYIAGTFSGTVDFDPGVGVDSITSNGASDMFVTKLTSDGSYGWTHTVGGASYVSGRSLSIDINDNIYIAGLFTGSVDFKFDGGGDTFTANGLDDIFVMKINNNDSYAWTKIFSSEGSDDDLSSITTDQNNNLYLTGAFYSAMDFNPGVDTDIRVPTGGDIFIVKLNNDGSYGWTNTIDGVGYGKGNSVRVDGNNIFLTGTFDGTVDFDPTVDSDYRTSLGDWDIFIAQYSDGGNYLGAVKFGGTSLEGDIGSSIAIDSNSNLFLTGRFFDTVDFDPSNNVDSKVSNGDSDIFIMRFDAL